MSISERIILFTRYPEVGRVKTRLISVLGPEGSCALHRQMVEQTVKQLADLSAIRPMSIEVRFEGGNQGLMREWLGQKWDFSAQGPGHLGLRMGQAFQEAFQAGLNRIVIIGSDIPGLTSTILEKAFDGLTHYDLVLGPARDGGYYLVGLSRWISSLFIDIPWGTEKVCQRTVELAHGLGLKSLLLEPLEDIDRPEDLPLWKKLKIPAPRCAG